MLTYEIRLCFADGYEIVTVLAETCSGAVEYAARLYPDADRVRCVGIIDRRAQVCLAVVRAR
jgi:hypothetical protein